MDIEWTDVVSIVAVISVCASAITAATPTPKDDRWWAKIYSVIEGIGLVVGKAKDK